jgi:modification methylase
MWDLNIARSRCSKRSLARRPPSALDVPLSTYREPPFEGEAPLPPGAVAAVADKRSEPRIPFAAIVEAGLNRPGEILADERKRHAAMVRADGTVSIGAITGSIHKIGALVQGLPACNGWTFWHFERDGTYEPIDALRSLLRASLRQAA